MPTLVAGLPNTAASRPVSSLSTSDSWGDSIAGVTRVAVTTGWAGSDMSTARTPAEASTTSVGNSSVVS